MNIILFGVGPFAKKIYLKYFQEHTFINKVVVVDLIGQEARVNKTLSLYDLDYEVIFTNPIHKNSEVLNESLASELRLLIKTHDIQHAVIATEPKAHKMYIDFCLKEGLEILCDKPLTTPLAPNSIAGAEQILRDYDEIFDQYMSSKSARFDIMTQRRGHEGFLKVFDIVSEVVSTYGVPITKIKVFHEDGNWPMPNEFINRENHPYKYGYGKLMHSGYHFVDLITMFMRANKNIGLNYSKREVLVSDYRSSDFMHYFGESFYEKLPASFNFNENMEIFDNLQVFENFGELDVSSIINFKNEEGRMLTQAILDLSQSSFSRRAWFEEPEDTYKGNGRVRHEFLEIGVGPLLNIKVLSFQCKENHEACEMFNQIGDLGHFEIDVFRNSALIGGEPFEKIYIEPIRTDKDYVGQNQKAKFDVLDRFFKGEASFTSLEEQRESISVLSDLYVEMNKRYPERLLYDVALFIENTEIVVKDTVLVTESIEDAIRRIMMNVFSERQFTYDANGYHFDNGVLVYRYNVRVENCC